MTASKKEKEQVTKCKTHTFIVTDWRIRGGCQSARQLRCANCLVSVSLEELASKEWRESQDF